MASGVSVATKLAASHVPLGRRSALSSVGESSDVVGGESGGGGAGAGTQVAPVISQADGTGWMAFYCTTMLAIAIELAEEDRAYEDMASKFFEHFVTITLSINGHGRHAGLWCKEDQFYYDWVVDDKGRRPIAVRSLVGLLPLIAVEILDQRHIEPLTGFMERTNWFLDHRKHLADSVSSLSDNGDMRLLSCCSKERLWWQHRSQQKKATTPW